MKPCITILLLALSHQLTTAQKNFEGTIEYRFIKPAPTKNHSDTANVTVYFGKERIKLVLHDTEKIKDEKYTAGIIDFTKNELYLLNPVKKEFRTQTLDTSSTGLNKLFSIPADNKSILNIPVSAFTSYPQLKNTDRPGNICWYADTLFYLFNTNYTNQSLLRRFGNGKNICLGFKETIGEGTKDYNTFYDALSIRQEPLPDTLFSIPPDFAAEENTARIRRTTVVTDSVKTVIYPRKTAPKKSPSKNTHTKPTKSPATKPKE